MCFHAGDCRGSKLHTSLTSVGLGSRCGLMVLATKAAGVFPGLWASGALARLAFFPGSFEKGKDVL